MTTEPLYVSSTSGKNLWQEYRILPSALELDLHLFGTLRIPFASVRGVAERPPLALLDLVRGDYPASDLLRGAKLDVSSSSSSLV